MKLTLLYGFGHFYRSVKPICYLRIASLSINNECQTQEAVEEAFLPCMEFLNLRSHASRLAEEPEEQETGMKAASWLNVITILNFVVAAGLIILATAPLTKLIAPVTAFGPEWILSLPFRPFAWLIFNYTNQTVLAGIAIACLVGLAAAGGFGLRRRLNWARRCTILLYLLCMVYITPAMLLVALSTGAIWVVVPLGLVFLGGPMQIVWYLLQPQVKKATCAPDQTFSRVKFTSLFGLVTLGSLLFFIWLAMMTLQAIGRGIR